MAIALLMTAIAGLGEDLADWGAAILPKGTKRRAEVIAGLRAAADDARILAEACAILLQQRGCWADEPRWSVTPETPCSAVDPSEHLSLHPLDFLQEGSVRVAAG